MTVIIRGKEYTYSVSATIKVADEDSDENQAYQEVMHLLKKAGFTDIDIELVDSQPNYDDLD